VSAAVVDPLSELGQVIGSRSRPLIGGATADRSELTVRPLQALTSSIGSDTWASLTLGFGTVM
jgi:hypothetical protein